MAKQGRGLIMVEPDSHGRDGMPFHLCLAYIPRHLERTCPPRLCLRRWKPLREGDRIRVFHPTFKTIVGDLRIRGESGKVSRIWCLSDDFGWDHPIDVFLGIEAEMVKGVEYVPPVVVGRLEEPDHTWP